jgi:hypothetical protein
MGGDEVLPRPRRRALGLAAATVWGPCLLPLLLGLLRDCSHCLATYAKLFVIVPGVLLPVLTEQNGAWFGAWGCAATLALLVGSYCAARELPRRWLYAIQASAVVLVGLESVALAYALRM